MVGKFEISNMHMKPGSTLKLKGKILEDADNFVINLGQGSEKLALHFNPRFKENAIVCNSLDGSWGKEERDSHMCFSPGTDVKISVTFHGDKFKVALPDGNHVTFPNRLGVSDLSVQGGLHISSFKFD